MLGYHLIMHYNKVRLASVCYLDIQRNNGQRNAVCVSVTVGEKVFEVHSQAAYKYLMATIPRTCLDLARDSIAMSIVHDL